MKLKFIELTNEELAALDRPANGSGGFQSFMKHLQSQVNHASNTIKLTDEDLARIQHYAADYRQGGFQERLLATFGRALGPDLGQEPVAD